MRPTSALAGAGPWGRARSISVHSEGRPASPQHHHRGGQELRFGLDPFPSGSAAARPCGSLLRASRPDPEAPR